MIGGVLEQLCHLLNDHLRARRPAGSADLTEDEVVLIDGEQLEPLLFKAGAITLLLVNLEAERTTRPADPFRRQQPDGSQVAAAPELALNLHVLFVARYRRYAHGLDRLAAVIEFLQQHPVINRASAPALPPDVETLMVEFVTQPFSEQAELWNGLRSAYHPSALYRLRMVRVADRSGLTTAPVVEIERALTHREPAR